MDVKDLIMEKEDFKQMSMHASIKDAVYAVFNINKKEELDLDDISLYIQQEIPDFENCDLDVLRKRVSSYLSTSTSKTVKGKRVVNKESLYERVKNGKGGFKKGVYKLRKVKPNVPKLKPNPIPINEEAIVENTAYVGSAGEMAVCSELLFREYNVSRMSVDDGVDIVAIKNNKTYYIQVKTVQVRNASFGVKINEKSFLKYDSNECYYIVVTRSIKNQFLVFTADDIKRMQCVGDIKISNGTISLSFTQKDGCLYIKSSKIDYVINNFERIK